MANAFSGGCTCNNGCPFNAASGSGGCPKATCCKEPTECNKTINGYLDKIAAYKLKLRLLIKDYKKRPKSSCDGTFTKITKAEFEKDKAKIEKKIADLTAKINALKRGKKAALLIRGDPKSFCATKTTPKCGCC
jgi:hypothetical protein